MKDLVSVIMPVYNTTECYLRKAIESILKQTYINFEFIIVCDCPTDDSERIIEEYAVRDNRIKVFKNKINSGVAQTLNNSLAVAKGNFIARMDADDVSLPNRLDRQVAFLKSHPNIGIVFLNKQIIDENGKQRFTVPHCLKNSSIIPSLFFGCLLCHPSAMFRKSIIEDMDCVYNPCSKAEDYDLWTRLAIKGILFAQLNSKCFQYRVHSKQVTQSDRYLINKSAIDSLYSFISANNIKISREDVYNYSSMMTSYCKIDKDDYLRAKAILDQIINCDLVQKYNYRYLINRERYMRLIRFLANYIMSFQKHKK